MLIDVAKRRLCFWASQCRKPARLYNKDEFRIALQRNNPLLLSLSLRAGRNLSTTRKAPYEKWKRWWQRDETWALLSWLAVGQGAFLLLGTTTVASLVLLALSGVGGESWLARRLAQLVEKQTGLNVVFDGRILPRWREGYIAFKDVRLKTKVDQEAFPFAIWDVAVSEARLKVSLKRFLNGNGLVQSVVVRGLRGHVDRSRIPLASYEGWRHTSERGDYDLENVSVHDAILTVQSAKGFRPYEVSIINGEFPRLRKRWLLHDMLAAQSLVGMLDGSLFSLYIPEVPSIADVTVKRESFERLRILRMRALNVDFLANATSNEDNPLKLLTKGLVDIDVLLKLPSETVHKTHGWLNAKTLLSVMNQRDHSIASLPPSHPALEQMRQRMVGIDPRAELSPRWAARRFVASSDDTLCIKVDMAFHNLTAHIPLRNRSPTSVVSHALMKPLVSYLNEQRPCVPLSCYFEANLKSDLDGSWTIYESGIASRLSFGINQSFQLLLAQGMRRNPQSGEFSYGLWNFYALWRNLKALCASNKKEDHSFA